MIDSLNLRGYDDQKISYILDGMEPELSKIYGRCSIECEELYSNAEGGQRVGMLLTRNDVWDT